MPASNKRFSKSGGVAARQFGGKGSFVQYNDELDIEVTARQFGGKGSFVPLWQV
jgi:hypothetical protein